MYGDSDRRPAKEPFKPPTWLEDLHEPELDPLGLYVIGTMGVDLRSIRAWLQMIYGLPGTDIMDLINGFDRERLAAWMACGQVDESGICLNLFEEWTRTRANVGRFAVSNYPATANQVGSLPDNPVLIYVHLSEEEVQQRFKRLYRVDPKGFSFRLEQSRQQARDVLSAFAILRDARVIRVQGKLNKPKLYKSITDKLKALNLYPER